ncbi:NADP-dependent oxidoreductase [Flaviaesturariibacter flavus]|uniref:NADP-dependent oxidoreductase n=1 Tax=Flaviaesturariibacter flavus TaxID=2502780 RepID=A0A4R1BBP5_9BACT|nr:NADP-dependent oxidoreductase [Flaviaesturariibacter flavus]TCJ14445.1 NADP-dependent oxidoreductase [Flaviaesturariibacter flavus]
MKAIVLNGAGGTDRLQVTEVEKPRPAEGELLVRVRAISVNPVDIKTRKGGAFYAQLEQQGPVILGWDVSGLVEAAGPGAQRFKVGDDVFGMVNFPGAGKAYAEYVTAPEAHFARKPEHISHEAAAATTLAALTAWQVLVHEGGLQAGQRVLVHAAAGGVGHFAVQIARERGATVYGTASEANHEFVRGLGAALVIDYRSEDFRDRLKDIDLVLDPVGGETALRSLDVLRPGGQLISIVGGAKEPVATTATERGLTARNYLVHSSGADMEALARLMADGKLVPTVGHVVPFGEMAAAHAQVESGHTRGKVVLTLR